MLSTPQAACQPRDALWPAFAFLHLIVEMPHVNSDVLELLELVVLPGAGLELACTIVDEAVRTWVYWQNVL